ncbi:MAG: DUF58 domain-containing protein [Chloroflexota bacterium]
MPNRRLGIYLLLIACLLLGLYSGRRFFFNLAYLFGALIIFSLVWAWTSVNWVRLARRTRARRAQVGRTLDETFSIRNASILPKIWLEVRDHSDLPGHNPSVVAPMLWPRQTFHWTAHTTCVVRGEYTLGPITLVSGDPFGLFQVTRKVNATSKVLIYPATVPVHSFTIPTGLLAGGDAQRQRTHAVTTNAAGVREYAPGDSFNRIHWRSSARKDRLLVKEFELDPMADVWILLDLSMTAQYERPYTLEGWNAGDFFVPPSTIEYGIVISASLVEYFLTKERALGFVTYTPVHSIFQPDRGNRQLTRIFEALTVARAETDVTCDQLVALEGHHLSRGSTVVIITADPTDNWISEAALLVRRGLRIVAIVMDPYSFGEDSVRSIDETQKLLEANGVLTYIVHQGDNLTAILSQR